MGMDWRARGNRGRGRRASHAGGSLPSLPGVRMGERSRTDKRRQEKQEGCSRKNSQKANVEVPWTWPLAVHSSVCRSSSRQVQGGGLEQSGGPGPGSEAGSRAALAGTLAELSRGRTCRADSFLGLLVRVQTEDFKEDCFSRCRFMPFCPNCFEI